MNLDLAVAFFALDETTPVELAVTPLNSLFSSHLPPSVAAHLIATVEAGTLLEKSKSKFLT